MLEPEKNNVQEELKECNLFTDYLCHISLCKVLFSAEGSCALAYIVCLILLCIEIYLLIIYVFVYFSDFPFMRMG